MKRNFGFNNLVLTSFLSIVIVGIIGWKGTNMTDSVHAAIDTLPKEKKVKDWEDILSELEKSKLEIQKTFREIDFSKMEKELNQTKRAIETEKIKADVEKAMKEIDAAKMKADTEAILAKMDWNKMKHEIKLMSEKELPKLEAELKKITPQMQESIEKAKLGIEKAKNEIKEYQNFTDALDKDGLINKKKNYTIENRDDKLIINGTTQPAEIYNKYRPFLDQHPGIIIKKDENGLNISKN